MKEMKVQQIFKYNITSLWELYLKGVNPTYHCYFFYCVPPERTQEGAVQKFSKIGNIECTA